MKSRTLSPAFYACLPYAHSTAVEQSLSTCQDKALAEALTAGLDLMKAFSSSVEDVQRILNAREKALHLIDSIHDDLPVRAWLTHLAIKASFRCLRLSDVQRLLVFLERRDLGQLPTAYHLMVLTHYLTLARYRFDHGMGLEALKRMPPLDEEITQTVAYLAFTDARIRFLQELRTKLSEVEMLFDQEMARNHLYREHLNVDLAIERAVFHIAVGRIDLLPKDQFSETDDIGILVKFYRHLLGGDGASCQLCLGRLQQQGVPAANIALLRCMLALNEDDLDTVHDVLLFHEDRINDGSLIGREFESMALSIALRQGRADQARMFLQRLDPQQKYIHFEESWIRYFLLVGKFDAAVDTLAQSLTYEFQERLIYPLSIAYEQSRKDLNRLWVEACKQLQTPKTESKNMPFDEELALSPWSEQESDFVGDHPSIHELRQQVRRLSQAPGTILVTGETGTGKEVIANILHALGPHAKGPFIAVNCAGLPPSMIEAELFGHIRGAFTGADRDRPGAFSLAAGGTLVLDELESMPLQAQALLLRVLEGGDYWPIGSKKPLRLTARVIALSNQPLGQLVEQNQFRQDLLYRLDRFSLSIPPLRNHTEDIPILVQHLAQQMGLSRPLHLSHRLLTAWRNHPWPGNVRELRNEIEHMIVLHGAEGELDIQHSRLAKRLVHSQPSPPQQSAYATQEHMKVPLPLSDGPVYAKDREHAIISLLEQHETLSQKMVCLYLQCSASSARRSLQKLMDAGKVVRIETSGNLRTAHFVLTK